MGTLMQGHPSEPETFLFAQRMIGPDNSAQTIRACVVYDSRWPWWKSLSVRIGWRLVHLGEELP